MSTTNIMRRALEEIASGECEHAADGDVCAEGDECHVCTATLALQDVDAEERAERRVVRQAVAS